MASSMGNQEIARRYATAFFDLAREQNQTDRIAGDLQGLRTAMAESADFARLLADVTLSRDEQARAVLAVAEGVKFSALTQKFLGTLAQKRRLALLPDIIAAAEALLAAHRGEVTAEVTAAHALEKGQADGIAAALKKALGADVKLKLAVDPGIIGGLVVRVGSRLIDSSVRTKLRRLARALKTQNESAQKNKMREVA